MGTDPAYGLKCPCCRLELQRKWTRTHPHGNVGRGQSVHFPQDFLECGLYRKTHRRGLAEIQIPGQGSRPITSDSEGPSNLYC